MEAASTKKSKKAISKEKLQEAYMEYVLLNENIPHSVFAFSKHLKIKEAEFYDHYNSFNALEGDIWKSWFDATVAVLHKDDAYNGYSIREKLLSLYYTWFEVVKGHRSYLLLRFERVSVKQPDPSFLKKLKVSFLEFMEDLVIEGKDSGEVAERRWSQQYSKGFWLQFIYLTKYWADDDSDGFEQTDALIEKMSNFSMDMISRGALDSFLDLAKFFIQQGNR